MIQLAQQGMALSRLRTPLTMDGITALVAVGDSITAGTGASPSSNSYINKTATKFTLSTSNLAVGGRGGWEAVKQIKGASYTRNQTLLSGMFGFNDWRRGGTNAKTFKKVQACIRYMIAKFLTSGTIPSSHSLVTRTGSIVGTSLQTTANFVYGGGAAPGNFASRSSATGDSWEYTFTGTGIGFIYAALDGVTYTGWGDANVYIDGVLVDTITSIGWFDAITDGAQDNGRGAVPWIITGLSPGSHTIKVQSTSTLFVNIDFFFELIDPALAGNLILWKTPRMDATGYATAPANATEAIFAAADDMIVSEAAPYIALGYKIRVADVPSYYNVATDLDTDHIHPNNTGHLHIYNSGLAVLL